MADLNELKARRALKEDARQFGYELAGLILDETGDDVGVLTEAEVDELIKAKIQIVMLTSRAKCRAGKRSPRDADRWSDAAVEGLKERTGEALADARNQLARETTEPDSLGG